MVSCGNEFHRLNSWTSFVFFSCSLSPKVDGQVHFSGCLVWLFWTQGHNRTYWEASPMVSGSPKYWPDISSQWVLSFIVPAALLTQDKGILIAPKTFQSFFCPSKLCIIPSVSSSSHISSPFLARQDLFFYFSAGSLYLCVIPQENLCCSLFEIQEEWKKICPTNRRWECGDYLQKNLQPPLSCTFTLG